MKYVIDSSVAFERLVSERDSDKALRFEDEYVAGLHDLIAPDVFPVEIAHSLTRAGRQGRIAVSESVRLLRVLLRTLPDLHLRSHSCPSPVGFRPPPRSGCTTARTSPLPSARDASSSRPTIGW